MTIPIITRTQAKEQGLKKYFTGVPCKHNHISERSVATTTCIDCTREKNIRFKENNPEYKKRYYRDNKETCLAYNRKWQQNNSSKVKNNSRRFIERCGGYSEYGKFQRKTSPLVGKLSSKRWRAKHPHKTREYSSIRRTALEYAIPSWYDNEVDLICQIYQKRDELSEKWGIRLEVDHIIPLKPRNRTVSGLHCWHNLQLLERSVNGSKHDQYQTDW